MSIKTTFRSLKNRVVGDSTYSVRVRDFQSQIKTLKIKVHENFEFHDLVQFFGLINSQAALGELLLPENMIELENQFNSAIRNLTHSSYGINRASVGAVSVDNIWIGDIYGFNTKTLRFWLEHSDPKPLAMMKTYYQTMLSDYLGEFVFLNESILA
jgi:hypothetical protein